MLDVDFVFDVSQGSTTSPDDVGAVAVVDGSKSLHHTCLTERILTGGRNPQIDSFEAGGSSSSYGSQ